MMISDEYYNVVDMMVESTDLHSGQKILVSTKADQTFVFLNSIRDDVKIHLHLHGNDRVFNRTKAKVLKDYKNVEKILTTDDVLGDFKHKYDCVLGNPPFNLVSNGVSRQLWADLCIVFYHRLKKNGVYSMLHSGTWKFLKEKSVKNLHNLKNIYSTDEVLMMNFYNLSDGMRLLGQSSEYDIVTLRKNKKGDGFVNVLYPSGDVRRTNIKDSLMIPIDNIDIFNKLKAKTDEEKVNIIHNASYSSGKPYLKDKPCDVFKHPCVYTMPKNELVVKYSSRNDLGHFNIPKVIAKKGATWTLLDTDGKYAMTEFACAVVDEPKNLPFIQRALDNPRFHAHLMSFAGQSDKRLIDPKGKTLKFLAELHKDFWKHYQD